MANNPYNPPTESIVRVTAEYLPLYSGTIQNIARITNKRLGSSVFYDRQANILTKSIGNFKSGYEVVSTTGRLENNLSFRANNSLYTGSLVSASRVEGDTAFLIPSRSRNETVIAVRFSAPGGPEVMSLGYLDLESQEYSAYNSLNARNSLVRLVRNQDLQQHTDLSNSASYTTHKTNKNTRYYAAINANGTFRTESLFDNGFVSHQIPFHMDQAPWIYNVFDKTTGSWASRLLRNQSQTGSEYFYTETIRVNSSSVTGAFMNDYGSVYGFPSWQQLRASHNSLSRLLQKNSYYTIDKEDRNIDNTVIVQPQFLSGTGSLNTSSEGTYLFKEPAVDFRNETVEYDLYQNDFDYVTLSEAVFHSDLFNDELNNFYNIRNERSVEVENLESLPNKMVKRVKKQLFPSPKYSFLKRYNSRELYHYSWSVDPYIFRGETVSDILGWHFNRMGTRGVQQTIRGYTTNLTAHTTSIWPLDYYGHPQATASDGIVAGELMLPGTPNAPSNTVVGYVPDGGQSLYTFGIGGYVPWTAFSQSNSVPFEPAAFDDIRKKYSHCAVVAEHNLSSHITSDTFNSLGQINKNRLELYHTGSEQVTIFTDPVTIKNSLTFNILAILKLRPYKNFYPVHFSLETAKILSESLSQIELLPVKTAMKPFYKSGILYNSIRGGCAVPSLSPSASFESIFDVSQYLRYQRLDSFNLTQSLAIDRFQNSMNNFLEEVRHTFCQNDELQYFRSKPENQFNIFNSGTKYSMDIHLSTGKLDLTGTSAGVIPWKATIGGVNYLYGDPTEPNIAPWWQNPNLASAFSLTSDSRIGNSTLRIEFTPTVTRVYTIDEIFALSTKEIRMNPLSEKINDLTPSVTGSFNVFEKQTINGNIHWVINSKWEFPFLAMTGAIMSYWDNAGLSNGADGGVFPARPKGLEYGQYFGGLWHDFCEVPAADQGLFLNLNNVDFYVGATRIRSASLADQVGFLPEKKRASELRTEKEISELLCIVPVNVKDQTFFTIETQSLHKINGILAQKYMLPPLLGFKNNRNLSEKSILFFGIEIKDTWTKRDLAYIWQNLLPQNGLQHSEQNTVHAITDPNILSVLKNQEVYFMVFKCKLRSVSNKWPKLGRNWPWDDFSLTELVKIDIETEELLNNGPI